MKTVTAIGEAHLQRVLDDYPFTMVCYYRQNRESYYLVRDIERLLVDHREDDTVVCFVEVKDPQHLPPQRSLSVFPTLIFFRGNEERGRLHRVTSVQNLFGIMRHLKNQ